MSDERPDPPERDTTLADSDHRTAPNVPRRTKVVVSALFHDDRNAAGGVDIHVTKTGETANLHPDDAKDLRDALDRVLDPDGPNYVTVGGGGDGE